MLEDVRAGQASQLDDEADLGVAGRSAVRGDLSRADVVQHHHKLTLLLCRHLVLEAEDQDRKSKITL